MHWVFDKSISFEVKALKLFQFQAKNCSVYSRYLDLLKVNLNAVDTIYKIPFIPIELFKSNQIISDGESPEITFSSSGTTGQQQSKHYVADVSIYQQSFKQGFNHFYGNPKEYRILALLPSYLEREGSSLVYMCDQLIQESQHPQSGFYLHNLKELSQVLAQDSEKKTLLIGVSYALRDLAEQFPKKLTNTIVMETGGMKGKRQEMIKSELHNTLIKAFQVQRIHSEFGMTELLSQAYSKGKGLFETPPWMKVLIRDPEDPLSILENGRTGGINVIDLANLNSCAFIATQDLGKIHSNNQFEVLGRFENSDIRGCNLMIQ